MRFFKKQFKRKKYRLGYKRLATFWLKYLNQRCATLRQNYEQFEYDNGALHYFCYKIYFYYNKTFKHFFVDHVKNFSAMYLSFKVNKAYGLSKVGRGMFKWRFKYTRRTRKNGWTRRYIPQRYRPTRHLVDVWTNREAAFKWTYFRSLGGRNNFWLRNRDRRKFLKLVFKKYHYIKTWRPFSYIQKKYKLYFNWRDYAVYQRYPMYRRKFTVTYLYPRFADYRRLFINQIREQQFFRWLFRYKYKQLVNKFKKSVAGTKRAFELMFLNFFELRMDVVMYRCNFAFSIKQAKQWANRGFFQVNHKIINWYSYHVGVGDILMPIAQIRHTFLYHRQWFYKNDWGTTYMHVRSFYRQIQADQYPSHLTFNERIPAALIISQPDPFKVRFHRPFSIQFLTLSFNKYS